MTTTEHAMPGLQAAERTTWRAGRTSTGQAGHRTRRTHRRSVADRLGAAVTADAARAPSTLGAGRAEPVARVLSGEQVPPIHDTAAAGPHGPDEDEIACAGPTSPRVASTGPVPPWAVGSHCGGSPSTPTMPISSASASTVQPGPAGTQPTVGSGAVAAQWVARPAGRPTAVIDTPARSPAPRSTPDLVLCG